MWKILLFLWDALTPPFLKEKFHIQITEVFQSEILIKLYEKLYSHLHILFSQNNISQKRNSPGFSI